MMIVALRRGAVKGDHRQMEVDGQGVHHHDFMGQCADEPGGLGLQKFVVVHPRQFAAKVTLHAVCGPLVKFGEQGLADCFGLEAEGVAAEVEDVLRNCFVDCVFWKNKLLAKRAEGVLGILGAGEIAGIFVVHIVRAEKFEAAKMAILFGHSDGAALNNVSSFFDISTWTKLFDKIEFTELNEQVFANSSQSQYSCQK